MRRFANLFIVCYLAEAGLALVDVLLQASSFAVPLLGTARYVMFCVVAALAAVIFACLGIDRRLPKRVFLPLTLYVFWCSLALWPLSGLVGRAAVAPLAVAGQLLLGGLALALLRRMGGRPLLTDQQFRGPLFSLRNTLGFTAINLLLLPFAAVYSVLAVAGYVLEDHTAGFLRLGPLGIYMAERSYHRQAQVVRLAGMMHIGKEDYFADLAGSMAGGGTIILTEGVTDRDRLLESRFNYGKLAGIIGLSSQETMQLDGRSIELADLDGVAPHAADRDKPDIARADLDLSQFDPQTVEFLNVLGRTLFGGGPLLEGIAEYNAWVSEYMTPERIAGVMADILDKRNAVVIDGMVRSLGYYDTVVIPWGAMHMPAIEAAVLEQGFTPGTRRERLSLDFRTLPYAEMWRKWSTLAESE